METASATTKQHIFAFVDAPDPDNFVQLIALRRLNPDAALHVVLTGRPVRFNASRDHKLWEWDLESSQLAQEASALRAKNFLRHFGVNDVRVFDGGIAPRTLVPHWVHFAEYYKFLDVDPLHAIRHSELEAEEELAKVMLALPPGTAQVAVGGPMTGLYKLLVRCPEVANRIKEVHAMFATWGNVKLMQFDDKPRDPKQFNVYCDPQAAHAVLMGLTCPLYLMPTEVTRVPSIGFLNAQALREHLPDNSGARALYNLYALWYDAAVKPRQAKNPEELIFIHDFVAALSLNEKLRKQIYKVVPVKIRAVPHLATEASDWGKVDMLPSRINKRLERYAATSLTEQGPRIYLETLKAICA
ncbi:MAG: nucleoside hydrolase [Candidatus Obscuribacterales bacterium]|nr:nucleoside hydrolase [Candidatus Obscuribacterales bacterium]